MRIAIAWKVEDGSMDRQLEMRGYERGDLKQMVELDEACFAPPYRFSREAMRNFAEARNAWVTVAESEGRIVGFCIVHRERGELSNPDSSDLDFSELDFSDLGYVVTIDVEKSFRGLGVGKKMLMEGESWVKSWKGAGMLLHVFTGNDDAVRFYERMRYGRVEVQRGFYGPGLDAAMYWKPFR
jgi:ribosomal-protein-alanine N-acetyltransferase